MEILEAELIDDGVDLSELNDSEADSQGLPEIDVCVHLDTIAMICLESAVHNTQRVGEICRDASEIIRSADIVIAELWSLLNEVERSEFEQRLLARIKDQDPEGAAVTQAVFQFDDKA